MSPMQVVTVTEIDKLCSYIAPDYYQWCARVATFAVVDEAGNAWWRCPAHKYLIDSATPGYAVTHVRLKKPT